MKLLYFAWVRDAVGTGEEQVEVPLEVTTVAELADWLSKRGGGYATIFADRARLRVAVDQQLARFDTSVRDVEEVAFFPPVTGG